MRFHRFLVILLLAIFLADTAAASVSLHFPAVSASAMQSAAHQQHAMHDEITEHDAAQQHVDNCRSCHDCLSCFSALPLSISVITPDLPRYQVVDVLAVIYFPPALAPLQRPPIIAPI